MTDWQVHVRSIHRNFDSETFTTHENLGHVTAVENTAGTPDTNIQGFATTPVNVVSAPPFGLGKPSFKRRKLSPTEESMDDQPAENPVTVTENTSKGSGLLSALWAKMGSFNRNSPLQNESSPSVEVSEDQPLSLTRDPPRHTPERIVSSPLDRPPSSPSPPPPPPPPLPSTQEDVEMSLVTSPIPPLPSPVTPPPLSSFTKDTDIANISNIASLASPNDGIVKPPSVATIEKAIVCLAKGGFRLDEIHRGCQNHLQTDLSYEFIQSVIERHQGARLPDPPPPETLNAARVDSRSPSIVASPVPSNSEFNRESSPMPKSSSAAPSSNILIQLDELSPEERLKALEALQSDLPTRIESLRQQIREEEARKERERLEQERIEQERIEKERVERERIERERIAQEDELLREKFEQLAAEIQQKNDELERIKRKREETQRQLQPLEEQA